MNINVIWDNYFSSRNKEDRDSLIEYYYNFTRQVAMKVASDLPSYVKLEDLVSSAITGLISAIERFNPEKGVRFESYAYVVIRGAIIDDLRKLDWVPRSVHEKAQRVEKKKEELRYALGQEPSDQQLASALNISLVKLQSLLDEVKPAVFIYLNDRDKTQDREILIEEKIADKKHLPCSQKLDRETFFSYLKNSLSELNEKERLVVQYYYFEEMVLKEIGSKLGVSESRVCQIHSKALEKLKTKLHFLDFNAL